jgi:hypothetical protein
VPPLKDLFDMAGMDLPTYLAGKKRDGGDAAVDAVVEEVK